MMRALNLLHYPSQARQKKVFHRCWTSLAGVLLGGVLAWSWLHWLDLQTEQLQQEQKRLQTSLASRTQMAKDAARRHTQSRVHAEQLAHVRQVAQHQQAWVALHESLQTQARQSGLRLERLQVESEKIELQGTGVHVEAITQAQQKLSDQLDHPLALTSITATPTAGVGFILQAKWSGVGGPSHGPLPHVAGAKP